MDALTSAVVAANTVTLVFGSAIVFLAYRAYTRTGSRALRALSAGLGLVTLGTLFGGSLHQLTAASLLQSIAVQSTFTALGFVVLAYSLFVERAQSATIVSSTTD
ncbi:hypothetical protein GCM10028857_08590 [Salinarchaeum chitinilyticum]